ncbi:uncharacterized protein LOC134145937 [Rhea pennata]|uniref:uncharacterized protein LOC134145937 n=1 Tax=Rhea pennata TaxID=8795 RepID=UPI002E255361
MAHRKPSVGRLPLPACRAAAAQRSNNFGPMAGPSRAVPQYPPALPRPDPRQFRHRLRPFPAILPMASPQLPPPGRTRDPQLAQDAPFLRPPPHPPRAPPFSPPSAAPAHPRPPAAPVRRSSTPPPPASAHRLCPPRTFPSAGARAGPAARTDPPDTPHLLRAAAALPLPAGAAPHPSSQLPDRPRRQLAPNAAPLLARARHRHRQQPPPGPPRTASQPRLPQPQPVGKGAAATALSPGGDGGGSQGTRGTPAPGSGSLKAQGRALERTGSKRERSGHKGTERDLRGPQRNTTRERACHRAGRRHAFPYLVTPKESSPASVRRGRVSSRCRP